MRRFFQVVASVVALAVSSVYGAQDTAALPSVKDILQRAADQSQKEDDIERAFKQHYSYTRTKVTEYRGADGDLKKREEKKRSHKPVIAPAPVPKPAPKVGPAKVASKDFNPKDRAFEKSDFALTDDLLNRFEFTLKGRETIDGRTMLVLDFEPASKDLPERSIKDKFINRAAGRVWLDEQDYALAKADLRLTERVNVVGGLVGAVWKFNYKLSRERTSDGLWYARNVDWHLEGREVFSKRVIDYHEQKTDVKKAWEFQSASR